MAHFRIRQNNMTVASAEAADFARAEAEILHYAMQYRADGQITIQRQHDSGTSKWWKRHMLMEQWPPTAGPSPPLLKEEPQPR